MKLLFSPGTDESKDCALLLLRVGIGTLFAIHGFTKLSHGPKEWLWLGNQMQNLGISFAPLMWGFLAALSESMGGLLLIAGLGTRLAAASIFCTMFVALVMHITNGDAWSTIEHPVALTIALVGLCVAGAGAYSLDAYITKL